MKIRKRREENREAGENNEKKMAKEETMSMAYRKRENKQS